MLVALQIIKLCVQFFVLVDFEVTLDKVFNFVIVVSSVVLSTTLLITCFVSFQERIDIEIKELMNMQSNQM